MFLRTTKNIASLGEDKLIIYHHSLGRWIRNNMGLWSNNSDLLKACNCKHPDSASTVILEAFHKRLREKFTIIVKNNNSI